MSSKAPRATLNAKQLLAVPLVAAGEHLPAIAARLHMTDRQLFRWVKQPAFAAAVAAETERLMEALRKEGLTNKQNRLDALNADFARLEQVLAERSRDPLVADVPGGETGLIVAEPILIKMWDAGDGERDATNGEAGPLGAKPVGTRVVYSYKIDDALLHRRQQLAKQMAIEIGEWEERRKVAASGQVDGHIVHEHTHSSRDFDYDRFAGLFARVVSIAAVRDDGPSESVYPPHSNGSAGLLSEPSGS